MTKTMSDKIWDAHEVAAGLVYVDLHLVHEVTSPQAFDGLRLERRGVRRPDRTVATADHNVPTDGTPAARLIADELSRIQVETLERNCAEFGIPIYSLGSERRRGGASGRGHTYEVMTPPLPGQRAEVSLHTLRPGSSTGGPEDPPMHEAGSRETAVVTEGSVRLVCAGLAQDLDDGDAVTFDADLPHHFENMGDSSASFIAVVAAGLRRS